MKLLQSLFETINLVEAAPMTFNDFMSLVRQYKPNGVDAQRFVQWVAGNTRGDARKFNPNAERNPMHANGVQLLDKLTSLGYLKKTPSGNYAKASDVMSQLIQTALNSERESLEQGEGKTGSRIWTPNLPVVNDKEAENRLAQSVNIPGYKQGQERSGETNALKQEIVRK